MFKKYKISNFTGRINAFRVIERLERMNILGGQNTEGVKIFNYDIYILYGFIGYYFKCCGI